MSRDKKQFLARVAAFIPQISKEPHWGPQAVGDAQESGYLHPACQLISFHLQREMPQLEGLALSGGHRCSLRGVPPKSQMLTIKAYKY